MAIDGFVTPLWWPPERTPPWMAALVRDVFGRDSTTVFEDWTAVALLDRMDAAGVGRAVLNAVPGRADDVAELVAAHPERFLLSAQLDPRDGMAAVREARRLAADHDLRLVRMVPFEVGLPPSDAIYYPLYATCAELGVAVSVTTGMPASPRMPAEPQRPLHLDPVCRFFPDLTVIMAHGADPWWDEAIALMNRFPRLYLMTSDWAPRRLPESLVRFLGSRGQAKVLFASGFPMLPFERCLSEAAQLPLRPDALADYLEGNAARALALEVATR